MKKRSWMHWPIMKKRVFTAWLIIFSIAVGYSIMKTRQTVNELRDTAAAIVYSGCQETNKRHDDTITALNRAFPGPASAKGRQSTILLINALTPHRNCILLTRRRINAPLPKDVITTKGEK